MTSQLDISTRGPLGIIALNRPEAINALSREMVDGIANRLDAWRDDDGIRAVLFEGVGARGFCSGGDVRAARDMVLSGRSETAIAYFAAEYNMNGVIATYPKPTVAIGHGAVMGGGIGILGHCRYRFAAMDSRFAMPEAAIGFVSDIGVNAVLAQAPEARALAFLMSGLPVGMGDALTLGLCDAAVDPGRLTDLRDGVVSAAGADVETALVQLMQSFGLEPGPAALCALADEFAHDFAADGAEAIVAAIGRSAAKQRGLETLSSALDSRSPTSLEAIVCSHRAARRRPEIGAVLALDLRMAVLMSQHPDFAEGVRSVLVDRDRDPHWHPADFAAVDRSAILAAVAGGAECR